MGTTVDKIEYSLNAKDDITAAITEQGVEVPEETPLGQYGDLIRTIRTVTPSESMSLTPTQLYLILNENLSVANMTSENTDFMKKLKNTDFIYNDFSLKYKGWSLSNISGDYIYNSGANYGKFTNLLGKPMIFIAQMGHYSSSNNQWYPCKVGIIIPASYEEGIDWKYEENGSSYPGTVIYNKVTPMNNNIKIISTSYGNNSVTNAINCQLCGVSYTSLNTSQTIAYT